MKSLFLAVPLGLVLFSSSAFAQSAVPMPAPTPTPAVKPEDVVVISTNLIQIDATVTDKSGKVVKGLTADDFEIFENGVKQPISQFSYVDLRPSGDDGDGDKGRSRTDNLPTPTASTPLRPDQIKRTIAMVIDDLGLSFSSTFFVKAAMKKFVDQQMRPGDLVAIIRTGGGIGVLQQFTWDKRVLYAAIENLKFNPNSRSGISSFAPIRPSDKEEFNSVMTSVARGEFDLEGPVLGVTEDLAADQAFQDFRADGFAVGTLGAVGYVIRGMSALPGRKAVALMSEGFSMFDRDGSINSRINSALRNLTETANRSSVVIYSIDPRGLVAPGANASDYAVGLRDDMFAMDAKVRARERDYENSLQALKFLADETGGDAYLSQNDISKGIEKVLEKQNGYYLIGYEPDDETFDAATRKFNKLSIKLKRPDLKLSYRSGFFGVESSKAPARPRSALQRMADELNSPFAKNELDLKMNALFLQNQKGAAMRSFIHIKGGNINFAVQPDGSYKAEFNVLALIFDDNGVVKESVDREETVSLKADAYQEVSTKGLVYSLNVPIKVAGPYQMKIVIQDKASQKIGSVSQFIQIPNLKRSPFSLSGIALSYDRLAGSDTNIVQTDEQREIALRQFRAGRMLRFGFAIYSAKGEAAQLTSQIRLFKDGREISRSPELPANALGKLDPKNINVSGVFGLDKALPAGDYIFQVIIRDSLRGKRTLAAESIDFEVIK